MYTGFDSLLGKGRGGGLAKGQEATPRTFCSVKQHGVLVSVSHLGIQAREQDRGDALNYNCIHCHSRMSELEGDREVLFGELCLQ